MNELLVFMIHVLLAFLSFFFLFLNGGSRGMKRVMILLCLFARFMMVVT